MGQARAPVSVDVMDALAEEQLLDESDPATRLHLERRLEALDRALRRLSPGARAVFILQRRDGCTVDEIAAKLGISRSMVKKHLARAMAHCSRQMQEEPSQHVRDAP